MPVFLVTSQEGHQRSVSAANIGEAVLKMGRQHGWSVIEAHRLEGDATSVDLKSPKPRPVFRLIESDGRSTDVRADTLGDAIDYVVRRRGRKITDVEVLGASHPPELVLKHHWHGAPRVSDFTPGQKTAYYAGVVAIVLFALYVIEALVTT